jgi:hypothetical protein
MNLDNYIIEELVSLKNQIENKIHSYEDGFFYICNIRSYGRKWKERMKNPYSLQELCYQYYGEDGIVDVYTNNPDLSIDNYGDVMYVPTEDDYLNWKEYSHLKVNIPQFEKDLVKWNNRENLPFISRPLFAPVHTQEMIDKHKQEMLNLEGTFVEPVSLKKYSEEEEI